MELPLINDTNDPVEDPRPADKSAVHITTDVVGARERAEYWQEIVCKNFVDVEFSSSVPPGFSGSLVSRRMGDLRISAIDASPHEVRSKVKNVAGPRENCVYATMMLEGRATLEQNGREALLLQGDLSFHDATRPHRLAFDQNVKMILVHLPLDRLREHVPGLEHYTSQRINGHAGVGAVAASFVQTLFSNMNDMKAPDQLAECALDLLSIALSSVKPDGALLPKSRSLSLYRVKEFIEQHLADPGLNIAMISVGVGLSPRYISKLFDDNDSSSSLSRYVWSRRLERCRQDLGNPVYQGHRISDIALRWGFNDLSHFSRTFKARFNATPREYRDKLSGKGGVIELIS